MNKLTPFEQKLKEIIDSFNDGGAITEAGVHYYATQLLDILKESNAKHLVLPEKTPVKQKTFYRLCEYCRTEFTYQEDNIQNEYSSLYGQYTFVTCPCCGKELDHYEGYNLFKIIDE